MKKALLFTLINMNIGGTEKALLSMLPEIPKDKYDVTILLLENNGELLEFIPEWVHIRFLDNYNDLKEVLNIPPQMMAFNLLKEKRIIKSFIIMFLHLIYKITKDRILFFKYILKEYPKVETKYDIAVAYAGPMDFITYYILNKVEAKKKVQWIHFDVTKIGFNIKFASKVYDKFDKIFTVSEEGKNKLLNKLPNLKDKTEVFLNIVSSDIVTQMALEGNGFQDTFDGVRVLTVGRLSKEKGQDLTIPVLARLRQDGYKVRWYCLGDGSARKEYEQLIRNYNVEDDYILLGSTSNPYPFMKQCDLYVQSSRHEGYCITIAEARCFNNPIISTNFTGVKEQLVDGQTGIIVECKEEEIYYALRKILDNEVLRNIIKENLYKGRVDTRNEIKKLLTIV